MPVSMKVMLLVAHGSRNAAANAEIEALARRVKKLAGSEYDEVVPAFLEFAEPAVQQGFARCVGLGASEIVVVPYFLAGGNHVTRDIPAEVACARAGHPHVNIELALYPGGSDAMASLILNCAKIPAVD